MEIKKTQEIGFRYIQNDKRSKSKFYEKYGSAKLNARVRPNNILVKARKSASFGDKNLATCGPKIWNVWKGRKKVKKM